MKRQICVFAFLSFSILMCSCFLSSCQNQHLEEPNSKQMIMEGYESALIRYNIMSQAMSASMDFASRPISLSQEQKLNEAVEIFDREGVFPVLEMYNIDEDIYFAAIYYLEHKNEPNVFDDLLSAFPDLEAKDFERSFDIVMCSQLIQNEIVGNSRAMSVGCGVALAGAVVSCASAVAIGNVAGLCWWLASYSFTLAGVVTSCA